MICHEEHQDTLTVRMCHLQRFHLRRLDPTAFPRAAPPQALRAVRATSWPPPRSPLLFQRQPQALATWHSRPSLLLQCILRPTPPPFCPKLPRRWSLHEHDVIRAPVRRTSSRRSGVSYRSRIITLESIPRRDLILLTGPLSPPAFR